MKIPLLTGTTVDTDKLSDKSAALHEAINNLFEVCKKYKTTGMSKVFLSEKENVGFLYIPDENKEIANSEYTRLISALSEWVFKTSQGRLMIIDTQLNEDEDEDEEDKEDNGDNLTNE